MSFLSHLNQYDKKEVIEENVDDSPTVSEESIDESQKTAEEILRENGFKIKLITRTAFGIQVDFAKKYDEDEIKTVLSDFNFKIKDKSVFIVD